MEGEREHGFTSSSELSVRFCLAKMLLLQEWYDNGETNQTAVYESAYLKTELG
jgi:hypothetical protein